MFDAARDAWLPEDWRTAREDTMAIVDGGFLLHPHLADHWDYIIWLDIDLETMVTRARQRDVAWGESAELVEQRYRRHWIPTHLHYEQRTNAPARAHARIDHRKFQAPILLYLVSL